RSSEGAGRYCVADAFPLAGATCFVAYLSDRLHLVDVFTDAGEHTTRAERPAVPLLYVYEPATGRILLKTRLRSRQKLRALVQHFGTAVLGVELPDDCL